MNAISDHVEVFQRRKGMKVYLDTFDNGTHQYINLCFDDDITETCGGHVQIKLDDEGVIVDIINDGDVLSSAWVSYDELLPPSMRKVLL